MLALQQQTAADSFPHTTSAYRLGQLSAQLGEICIPENYFVFPQDKRDYARGYRSVAGDTLTTRQILGKVAQ